MDENLVETRGGLFKKEVLLYSYLARGKANQ